MTPTCPRSAAAIVIEYDSRPLVGRPGRWDDWYCSDVVASRLGGGRCDVVVPKHYVSSRSRHMKKHYCISGARALEWLIRCYGALLRETSSAQPLTPGERRSRDTISTDLRRYQ
jgi:hypothetical protein